MSASAAAPKAFAMPPASPSTDRPFLLATAGFNYVAAAALLVWPLWFDALGVRPSPDNGLWLVLFAGVVAALGYGYTLAAGDFARHRGLVQIGAIVKLWAFAVAVVWWLAGAASWHLLLVGITDLIFALGLIRLLLRLPGEA